MFEINMYIRCPIDEDFKNPRNFITGQIIEINEFAEQVKVKFNDPFKFRNYYKAFPEDAILPISRLERCEFFKDSIVEYKGDRYRVIATDKEEWYFYYLKSEKDKHVEKVREDSICAPFTVGKVNPCTQLMNYEFQNPCWYFGRTVVSKTMHVLENSIYGFKELAGCKIFLMPYQLQSIMRCLQGEKCRYMLADEVGMGKTIEACSILKIFLSERSNARVLIAVPRPLVQQWKTELFIKFNVLVGKNSNNNYVALWAIDQMVDLADLDMNWDFVIVDEAHKLLQNRQQYRCFHSLSKNTENLLLLSATPVQQKRSEYLELLRLILPEKYDEYSEDKFEELVNKQTAITKAASIILSNLEDYIDTIEEIEIQYKESEDDLHKDEECEELFEELLTGINKVAKMISDIKFDELIEKINYDEDDLAVASIQIAMSYLCENYQIEKNIIRNRRRYLEDLAQRTLTEISYQLDGERNIYEYNSYQALVEWIVRQGLSSEQFEHDYIPIITAFFSSPWAFRSVLETKETDDFKIDKELDDYSKKWLKAENNMLEYLDDALGDPDKYSSRMLNVIDFIDQEIGDEKVVLFTNYAETFEKYESIFNEYFGEDKCCSFNRSMDIDELELSVYRFQNDTKCSIMLCDESGGEGRNFQCADYIVHIDLPWDANAIEQRIGRLDRLGREQNRDVKSVVVYAEDSLEEELFNFWNKGLNIFRQSLSGLEIIMNEINESIISAIINDFKYGLSKAISKIVDASKKMEREIREEQHFDTAAYKYRPMNRELIRLVNYYNANENHLFEDTMMNWSTLAGLRGTSVAENVVIFDENSFSPKSAENSMLIPPNWLEYINREQNQFASRVKALYETKIENKRNGGSRCIEGTFNRNLSIKNDYLHFFAPGDDIFDCIVDNALKSCKGQATAFAAKTDIEWKGVVFTWCIEPNEKLLLEHGISLMNLSQFRNYLTVDQVVIPVPFSKFSEVPNQIVKKELEKIICKGYLHQRDDVVHLGQRSIKRSFLNINNKYGISNVEWFKEMYLPDKWEPFVKRAYSVARKEAIEKLKERSNIKMAREEINKMLYSLIATAQFYGREVEGYDSAKRIYDYVLESLKKPNLKLESACYVWMVKE